MRGLQPKRELRGIEFGDEVQAAREIENLMMIVRGLYAEMMADGMNQQTKVGIMLIRARVCLDRMESRVYYDKNGEVLE